MTDDLLLFPSQRFHHLGLPAAHDVEGNGVLAFPHQQFAWGEAADLRGPRKGLEGAPLELREDRRQDQRFSRFHD